MRLRGVSVVLFLTGLGAALGCNGGGGTGNGTASLGSTAPLGSGATAGTGSGSGTAPSGSGTAPGSTGTPPLVGPGTPGKTPGTGGAPGTPLPITMKPLARFAYATSIVDQSVQAFTIDPIFGFLTPVGTPVPTGASPIAAAVHPTGKYLYVANQTSGDISTYRIDAASGLLTTVGLATKVGPNLNLATGLALHPNGKFAYAVGGQGTAAVYVYSIEQTTGQLANTSSIPTTGGSGCAVDLSGKLLYVTTATGVSIYVIDPATGALTADGSVSTPGSSKIACDPTGRFAFAMNNGVSNLSEFTVDPAKGLVPSQTYNFVNTGSTPQGIACHPSGKFLYVANFSSGDVNAYSIDGKGLLTEIGTAVHTGLAGATGAYWIDCEQSGKYVYIANFSQNDVGVFKVDPTTGALNQVVTAPTKNFPSVVVTAP